MAELPKDTTDKIRQLCAEAYEVYDHGRHREALRLFYQAWVLLPKPQTDFAEAGWVLTGIGDSYFCLKQYIPGCEALRSANHCPQTRNNPFIHLRLGQCLYHLGERASARTHLHKAFQIGGRAVFDKEKEEYLSCITDLIPAE